MADSLRSDGNAVEVSWVPAPVAKGTPTKERRRLTSN